MRRCRDAVRAVLALVLSHSPLGAQNRVVAEFPVALSWNKTIVPVTVGTSSPLQVILDSGMAYDGILLFDSSKVNLTQFRRLTSAQVPGAGRGGASAAVTDDSATFSVGARRFENQRVTILTTDAFKGFPTDGVIGYSLLGHYAVEVDHERNRMTLYEASSFKPGADWTSIDIYFKDNRIPWTGIAVSTAAEPPVQLATYIDCASGEALELLERTTDVFTRPVTSAERVVGRGLSGDIHGKEGRVSTVRFGNFVLRDVAVLVTPAEVRSRQAGADAIIGNNLLRRFNVIFDYAHQKIHLKPNRYFAEPFR